MSDLVERLRSCRQQVTGPQLVNPDGPEAADEIERLERVIAEAPHERGCPALGVPVSPFDPKNHRRKCGDCNCFKSRVT